MAITLDAASKDTVLDALRLDFVSGTLEIGTTGMATVLVTYVLDATGGTITANTWDVEAGVPTKTVAASATGIAAEARIIKSGGGQELTSFNEGTDFTVSNTSITSGEDIVLNSFVVNVNDG